ncbi:MAG: Spy/CpxP family protein refolding chaperone [Pseudomonadota bacterium]
MTTIRKHLAIAMAALIMAGSSLAVQAHEGTQQGGPERAARHAQMQEKWAARKAERQAKLHDALKLSSAQEPAWAAYQASLKHTARDGAKRADRGQHAAMPAPARMERMVARQKARAAAMEARLPAMNALYATLSPEQKKVFDEQRQGRGQHGQRHGRH